MFFFLQATNMSLFTTLTIYIQYKLQFINVILSHFIVTGGPPGRDPRSPGCKSPGSKSPGCKSPGSRSPGSRSPGPRSLEADLRTLFFFKHIISIPQLLKKFFFLHTIDFIQHIMTHKVVRFYTIQHFEAVLH